MPRQVGGRASLPLLRAQQAAWGRVPREPGAHGMWGVAAGPWESVAPLAAPAPFQRCFPFINAVIELKAEDRSKFLDALVTLLS